MESVGLEKVLKDLAEEPFFPLDYEAWAKDIVPNLPKEPIDADWLSKLVAPYHSLSQATVLEHLVRLGRKEVLPVALKCSEAAKGFDKLMLGGILIQLREARGYQIVEELAIHSIDHPEDKENYVAPNHVDDVLLRNKIDRKALRVRQKLAAYRAEKGRSPN